MRPARATIFACAAGAPLALAALAGPVAATPAPAPAIDPARFTSRVDNLWFPLLPGSVYRYRGTKDGKTAVDTVEVTRRTRRILGVPTVVVRDRLVLNGRLAERTSDWYAQDRDGTVWYFGEDTATLDARGDVVSREGSFQAGVDGARAGIFMPAHPRVGQTFQQEFYRGHAEDRFTVTGLTAAVRVPWIASREALRTRERTRLEPGVVDGKFYLKGIGAVKEVQLRGPGPRELLELASFSRPRRSAARQLGAERT
jgi:hypothetical protein